MGIIKASKLIYDYIRRDEEDHEEEVSRAIDQLTLDIQQGDFVAILGHNGSGKSTFAKQVNGILLPTEGTVWISGMDTRDDSHIWDIRKTAGMVFQNPDNQIIGNIVEEDGRLVMDGTPREIFSRVKELKEYRLDVPHVTELAWELKEAGVKLPAGILTMEELMAELLPLFQEKYPKQVKLEEK